MMTSKTNQYIIILTTKTKYRGVGVDIRNNGGYVVAPPSIIDNVAYEIINNVEVI